MPPGEFWSEDERHTAMSVLRNGGSLASVAAVLGRSRNAVAGRVHRDAQLKAVAPPVPARAHNNFSRPRPIKPKEPPPMTIAVPPRRIKKPPTPWRIPLVDLARDDCRWAVEESPRVVGGQLFCAHPVVGEGRSYCAYHDAIAHGRASEVR